MCEIDISVKKVNLQQEEVDRLNYVIEMRDNTIKYQQDQYLKLVNKLNSTEPFGLNNLLFSYEAIIEILKSNYHPLKDYLERWFGSYEDFIENEVLVFAEDGIELEKGELWLVNIITDYACVIRDTSELNRKIYNLEQELKND